MKRTLQFALGFVLTATVASDAAAQWNVARFDNDANRVYTTFGLDPALVTSVGYARVAPVFGHRFQFSGEAGVAATKLEVSDYRARLQMQTSVLHWRALYLTGSATFVTRGTENSIYRGLNFGADFTGTAGVYRPHWFLASEFGKDKAIISHITNSDWYRENGYAAAKDGWYLDAGGTYHYGVVAGLAVGRAELVSRFGWNRTERFNDLVPPMHASLGIGFGF